jgi:L-lactate dehydrogenase complex protein LldG
MSRDAIFKAIRHALHTGPKTNVGVTAEAWTKSPPQHPLPERAKVQGEDAIRAFTGHFEAQGVSVTRVARADDVPKAVAAFLSNTHPGEPLVAGTDAWLAALPWGPAKLTLKPWRVTEIPMVGLSRAVAGIAETGTLVLASGPDNPATLNYLPETHVAVIEATTIKGGTEEAFTLARLASKPNAVPRTLALVSGASRTADVGGKLVRGAHGPKRLAVIVVG